MSSLARLKFLCPHPETLRLIHMEFLPSHSSTISDVSIGNTPLVRGLTRRCHRSKLLTGVTFANDAGCLRMLRNTRSLMRLPSPNVIKEPSLLRAYTKLDQINSRIHLILDFQICSHNDYYTNRHWQGPSPQESCPCRSSYCQLQGHGRILQDLLRRLGQLPE